MKYLAADNLKKHKFIDWSIPEFTSEMSLAQQAYHRGWNDAIDAIVENEPTADVVEVVLCKDCKWFNQIGCAIRIVDDSDKPTENDFCSFGERREDAT